jgi:type IV secretion system protein VirB6
MAVCSSFPSPESFAPSLLTFLDCQAQAIGAGGYAALAASGSPASVLLTGMVTLLIALLGYRMLLGHTPTVREGVLTFVKIGLVLMLAMSWPAYQILVYDIILRAPAELATTIGGAASLPGSSGGMVERIDGVDQALKILAIEGVGPVPLGPDGQPTMPSVPPQPFIGFDSFAIGFARVIFLVATIASFAVVRIVAGLLLALAPLFAAFLLFDGTRGLFAGWLKALIGSALGSLAIAITLGVTLAFLEPWLATLLARRGAGLDIIGAPAQLLTAVTIFGLALAAALFIVSRLALNLHIPAWMRVSPDRDFADRASRAEGSRSPVALHAPIESRSRAAAIADAVAITQRREALAAEGTGGSRAAFIVRSIADRDRAERTAPSSAEQASTRRTRHRISARALARDRQS